MTVTPLPTGRRRVPLRPRIKLSDILTGTVPAHPVRVDYLATLNGGWDMLGNDRAGDCEAVRWANDRRTVTTLLTDTPHYPEQGDVWKIYQTQNPDFDPNGSSDTNGPGSNADRGMDTQTLCDYLVQHGGPDGVKAVAYAEVNIRNEAEVDAAISIFGRLWLDILVGDEQQEQFSEGKPWDWTSGEQPEGGHAVLGGGYSPSDDECADFITWAAETRMTQKYWDNGVETAWVVIWPEHLGTKAFQQGVDRDALAADYKAITGRDFPHVTA